MYPSIEQVAYNSSVPPSSVVPILPYPDVREAVDWLTRVFGFRERLQIAEHRSQMLIGDGGSMIVAEYIDRDRRPVPGEKHVSHATMVRISDVQAHFECCRDLGAEILEEPVEHVYGELQYIVRDIGGHRWTFSQTLRDAPPAEWGDENVVLKIP